MPRVAVSDGKQQQQKDGGDVESGGPTTMETTTGGEEPAPLPVAWPPFSVWRRLFFFDVDRLVNVGFRRRLEPQDCWREHTVNTERLVKIFEPALEVQKLRQQQELIMLRVALESLPPPSPASTTPADANAASTSTSSAGEAAANGHSSPHANGHATHAANGNGVPAANGAAHSVLSAGSPEDTGSTSASQSQSDLGSPTKAVKAAEGLPPPPASAQASSPATPSAGGKGAGGKGGPPGVAGKDKGGKGKDKDKPKLPPLERKRAELQAQVDSLNKRIDLKRVVLAGNGAALVGTGLLYIVGQACSLAGPLLLQRIVAGLQCYPNPATGTTCAPRSELYYYCIGLFAAPFIQSVCENHQTYVLYLAGTRMRNALMAAIYRKCLHLSNSSLQEESTGRVVTLMSNDAQKLQDAMMAIHALWGSPLYIVAVLVLLWQQVGWATLVGLAVMLLLAPLTGTLAAKLGRLRRDILQWTDKRVGYMNEIISGILMIKFYAWEAPFTAKVQSARSQEARILRKTAAWQGVFGMLLFSGPVLVAICCFGAWTLAGNSLTPSEAYAALALFALLRFPMSFLPMLITMVVNALVALKRIGTFLNKSESELHKEVLDMSYPRGEVLIQSGEFVWDSAQSTPTLSDIDLVAKPGKLTMIVGGVGSGKSSVLGALVGHMTKRGGRCKVGGRVAYVAQTAWIMNDTVQENVLMGDDPLDPHRYALALKVSQLGPDLDILPNGDMTEIGDRGVTLSGGQKQRVSIARAVYSDADVYLLDDPLSAVDSHVGRALFEECIRGPLKQKTVLLVTNALQYLPYADHVVWMEDGRIRAQGSYADLVAHGLDIAELEHALEDEEEAEEGGEGQEGAADKKVAADQVHVNVGSNGKGGPRTSGSGAAKRASQDKPRGQGPPGGASAPSNVTLVRSNTNARNLTGVEEREAGNLSWDVVKTYLDRGGGTKVIIALVFLYALEQGARVYTDRWVGIWAANQYGQGVAFYLGIYFGLGVGYGLITFIRSLCFLFMCVNAAVNLHNNLLDHLLRLPKSFFDTNPSGRILNRFSRDTDIMDSTLPASLIQFAGCLATYISILIVITIATKWFGIALVPLTIVYFFVQRYYIPTAREMQRIESITRSPIYNKFAEAMLGVCTIRAYRKEAHFTKVSDELMEANANAFMTLKLAASWLAMRLDLMGLAVLTGCGVLVIAGNVNPALAGLALVYALDLTRFLKHGTNMASKSESDFNSVERIIQYLKPEPEAAADTEPDVLKQLPPDWPTHGAMQVQDLTMRYRPEMPLVLRGITFNVEGGSKVGLVGRTGSGKSSILLALFRMVEPESGRVLIDGVDTRTLGVRHLRSKMSIIPQDPFMFSGTVRTNLDPFEMHTDDRLWEVLEAVGLKPVISTLDGALGAKVVDNGANFSLGQRQLFCMARAMLRDSKILMLDEATASVDVDTDSLIQYAIRTVFASCTMLTIAHRLNTIMDSDMIIVLEQGKVVEQGHADDLLKTNMGSFTRMVSMTGQSSSRYLRSLASSARMAQLSGVRMMPSFKGSFNSGSRMFNGNSFMAAGPQGSSPLASQAQQRLGSRLQQSSGAIVPSSSHGPPPAGGAARFQGTSSLPPLPPEELGRAPYELDEDEEAALMTEESSEADRASGRRRGRGASSGRPSQAASTLTDRQSAALTNKDSLQEQAANGVSARASAATAVPTDDRHSPFAQPAGAATTPAPADAPAVQPAAVAAAATAAVVATEPAGRVQLKRVEIQVAGPADDESVHHTNSPFASARHQPPTFATDATSAATAAETTHAPAAMAASAAPAPAAQAFVVAPPSPPLPRATQSVAAPTATATAAAAVGAPASAQVRKTGSTGGRSSVPLSDGGGDDATTVYAAYSHNVDGLSEPDREMLYSRASRLTNRDSSTDPSSAAAGTSHHQHQGVQMRPGMEMLEERMGGAQALGRVQEGDERAAAAGEEDDEEAEGGRNALPKRWHPYPSVAVPPEPLLSTSKLPQPPPVATAPAGAPAAADASAMAALMATASPRAAGVAAAPVGSPTVRASASGIPAAPAARVASSDLDRSSSGIPRPPSGGMGAKKP